MCCVVVFYASELAVLVTVEILHGLRAVELLHPHPHTHILHLEKLEKTNGTIVFKKGETEARNKYKIALFLLFVTRSLSLSNSDTMNRAMSAESTYPGPLA